MQRPGAPGRSRSSERCQVMIKGILSDPSSGSGRRGCEWGGRGFGWDLLGRRTIIPHHISTFVMDEASAVEFSQPVQHACVCQRAAPLSLYLRAATRLQARMASCHQGQPVSFPAAPVPLRFTNSLPSSKTTPRLAPNPNCALISGYPHTSHPTCGPRLTVAVVVVCGFRAPRAPLDQLYLVCVCLETLAAHWPYSRQSMRKFPSS
jgi:hypothetical protein